MCVNVCEQGWVAEGVGFEPTIRFPVYTLSKRAPSATRPPLRSGKPAQYSDADPTYNPAGFSPAKTQKLADGPAEPFSPWVVIRTVVKEATQEDVMGRGLLLWLLGIPLPIILLIWVLGGLHG